MKPDSPFEIPRLRFGETRPRLSPLPLQTPHSRHHSAPAFTLLELLVVITIIAVLLILTLPSLTGISSTTGRKGAVNVLLNTFEQARAFALENSVDTYVGFADKNFPNKDMRYRAYIIFRKRTENDTPPPNPNPPDPRATEFIVLTKWETLPRSISIKWEDGIVNYDKNADMRLTLTDASLPFLSSGSSLPALQFTPYGTISKAPTSKSQFCIYLYEGFYANLNDNFTRSGAERSNLFERISFSRFTGRAQLDVTTTQ